MALREIRLVPDPMLRQKARTVTKITPKIIELLDDMKDTLLEKDGIGLAAPQIGVLKRIFIVLVDDRYIEMINPEIIETQGLVIGMEGCLSVPDELVYVRRPHYVKVKGLNRQGEEIILQETGIVAIAICHEMDHLIGVLFTDRKVNPTPNEHKMLENAKDNLPVHAEVQT